MAYALVIRDENGFPVVEHVALEVDDAVYIQDAESYGIPQDNWRKAHHLIEWVKENKPNWKVQSKNFSIQKLFVE